ncbi:MAG: excinuclease ABC subunit A [Bacteroidetes bacterium]|nr:excinuclease ABC subunit A [Bacteroidota bacterium]
MHNLRNVDLALKRNQLTVVTGVSGSGKSSLVFDTLYAEGQRRYVESLSAYVRQFMGKMNKPEVEYIKGIAPAIAIEQKVNTRNPRSTVATSTEIYDYLKLLFAKTGKTFSPVSGKMVKRNNPEDVVQDLLKEKPGTTALIMNPLPSGKSLATELPLLIQKGYSRLYYEGSLWKIDDFLSEKKKKLKSIPNKNVLLVIDRLFIEEEDDELASRIADSAQTAFFEGHGFCIVLIQDETERQFTYSNLFEMDGIHFEEPSVNLFSFNNPYGACPTCEGFGSVIGIDEDLVIPDKSLSVYDGAVAPWRGETMQAYKHEFARKAVMHDFPIHRSYYDLSESEKDLLWQGTKGVTGIHDFFKHLEEKSYKIQYRVMLSKYRGKTTCPDCRGTRLRSDANYVKICDTKNRPLFSISDILLMPVSRASETFAKINLSEQDAKIADRPLKEIQSRLFFLEQVGLGYLTLNRLSNTLSGGESQRISLATNLGSSLVGSMYILDEPSIGLHPKDTDRLISVLRNLRDLGNTLIVVEHDEEVIEAADELVDIGPMAGSLGGELVFQGDHEALKHSDSLTGKYLDGREEIALPARRRKWNESIHLVGVRENNLKNVSVEIPLQVMTCITGVSGSGKTSLIKSVLYPALQKHLGQYTGTKSGSFDKLEGALKRIERVEMVDQNPIGKSSRSNPVTYIKAYDAIRELYASQHLSKTRAFKPQHFSFNVDGGRCDNCKGEGETIVEMQFMADLHLPCEVCHGKRFKEEVLEVEYKGKNIADVLEMTVDDALVFFQDVSAIQHRLQSLADVGLGYVTLGQSSSTLSGGEAQRIKLASFLIKGSSSEKILFIFDEPTTGLHFHDIKKLLASFDALIKQGHTLVVIEHNMDVVKSADWIIDLGPGGGEFGGKVLFEGVPEDLIQVEESATAPFLKKKLNHP